MKLLIFAETYYPDVMGGGEFSTGQMAEGLARKGHQVVVRCLGASTGAEKIGGVCIKRKYRKGLSEHFLSNTKNNHVTDPFTRFDKIARKYADLYPDKRWYAYYKAVIKKENPDLVHTATPMSYMGRMNLWKAAYDLGIPVSHVCRGPNLLQLKFLNGALDGYNRERNAKASSYLTALAAPSQYMLKCHNRVGIRGRKFNDVIYNAIDFVPTAATKEFVEEKENLILYAGEIRKEKGIPVLLKAMEDLTDARLLLIGRGEMADDVKKCGKAEVLDWMEQKELFACMKKAKAVILPSTWNEPFGRILIEAIGNAAIAIGSDKGGIPEVLDHQKEYLFHSGDAEALKARIRRVLDLSTDRYLEEINKQQKNLPGFSDEYYIDNWERFFLQQLR